ncbi:MAG TPA: outer membrane beta-barrel protein [Terriglobales bacterium]|nr:outer membrane beta-barrel protein [Terriglobales bacterium]
MKHWIVVLLLCSCSAVAVAQAQKAPPKWDLYLGYSLTHMNAGSIASSFNEQGGGIQYQYHFGKHLGLVGDLSAGHIGNIHNQFIDQTTYSLMGGPRYNFFFLKGNQIVYVEGLAGETREASHISVPGTIPIAVYVNRQWAVSAFVGGGTEFKLSPRIWFRPAEFGYYMTRFPAFAVPGLGTWNSNTTQNNYRFSLGFRFAI